MLTLIYIAINCSKFLMFRMLIYFLIKKTWIKKGSRGCSAFDLALEHLILNKHERAMNFIFTVIRTCLKMELKLYKLRLKHLKHFHKNIFEGLTHEFHQGLCTLNIITYFLIVEFQCFRKFKTVGILFLDHCWFI